MSTLKMRKLMQSLRPARPVVVPFPGKRSAAAKEAGKGVKAAKEQVDVRKGMETLRERMNLRNNLESLREKLQRDSFAEAVRNRLPALREALQAKSPTATPGESLPPVPQQSLSYDGGVSYQPGVEELQRNLVAAGYMTEEEMATGPGYFGPRTRAALARLQADHGIASDGSIYGPQSRAALTEAVQGNSPGTSSPGSPSTPIEGTPGVTPVAPGSPLAEVPLINQYAPNGATANNYWNKDANCGPTSAAMVARALGFGGGLSDAELVMQMYRAGGTTGDGSSPEQVAQMVRSLGVGATVVEDPSLAQLDAALADGKLVIANGDYFATGVPGRNGALNGGHHCVVTGKDANGNYLVNDPAGGQQVVFTPEAMSNFFREHEYNGAMVVVDQPLVAKTPSTEAPVSVGDVQLSPADAETARRVDALLLEYPDSGMHGMGAVIVAACRRERVPLDLVLAQLGKESTFLRSDNTVSIANNNPGNLRFASWESAFGGEPGVGGFAHFPSVEAGINAYVHLLGSPDLPYREMVDARDWEALVNVYAPPFENDTATYVRQMYEWTEYFGNKVGVDENWVNQ